MDLSFDYIYLYVYFIHRFIYFTLVPFHWLFYNTLNPISLQEACYARCNCWTNLPSQGGEIYKEVAVSYTKLSKVLFFGMEISNLEPFPPYFRTTLASGGTILKLLGLGKGTTLPSLPSGKRKCRQAKKGGLFWTLYLSSGQAWQSSTSP